MTPARHLALAALLLAALAPDAGAAAAEDAPPPTENAAATESAAASDDPLAPIERPIEDELVLEVRLGNLALSHGILGYAHRGGVLLALGEFTASLEFSITVEPAPGQADGWFLRENRTFFLDLARGEVVIEGRRESVPRGLAEVHFDDIYVDTTLLAKWFPVDIEFDMSRLSVLVTSREPLPVEDRLARESLQARLGSGAANQPEYPRQEMPYRPFGLPFIDTSMAIDFDGGDDGEGLSTEFTSLVTGDLLYMDANLFLSGNNSEGLDQARITLGRKDPYNGLLGPLRASEFSLGDVFTPDLPLVAISTEGRGATVSNFPLERPTEFDRTTLRGDLPLGWDVELYRNEVLVDFQSVPVDGRYEFIDVPLLFGLNVLRLVFYGPQGQRREEVQRLLAGPGLIRPGDHYWRLAVNQQREDAIPLGDSTITTDDEGDGSARLFGEYEVGLTQNLSVGTSIASYALDDGRHTYANLGLRASLFGAFLRVDAAQDVKDGTAVQGSLQTDLFGVNLFAEHARFFDFVSEDIDGQADPLLSRSNLRLDVTLPAGSLPRIPISIDGDLDRFESGRYDGLIDGRVSIFAGGVSASNTVSFDISGGGGTESVTRTDGSLLLNLRLDNLSLRSELGYDLRPTRELSDVAFTADYDFDGGPSARLSGIRQLNGDRRTTLSAGLFHSFDQVELGLNGSGSNDGDFSVGISLSFGLGQDPRTGNVVMRSRGMATDGAASARVFLDRNGDQVFDDGDEPLAGVRFQRQRDAETDEEGLVFLTGLSGHRPVDLAIDVSSIEDPFMIPLREGVEIVPRPGTTAIVDFPVTATGEVDGTVFLRRDEGLTEVSNVRLQLVGPDDEVLKEATSEFDGFYLFDLVPPGRYVLRVAPEQVGRLGLRPPPVREVAIEPNGNIVSGVDLILEHRADRDATGEVDNDR